MKGFIMNFLPTLNGLFKNKLIVGIFRLLKVEKWHTETPCSPSQLRRRPVASVPPDSSPLKDRP